METGNYGSPDRPLGAMPASARRYYALSEDIARRSRRLTAGCQGAGVPGRRRLAPSIAALLFLVGTALAPWTSAAAGEPTRPPLAEAPPPPPLPAASPPAPAAEPETGLEPEVTITTEGEITHEEYRLNGRLYMIKVIPRRGKPYYLIDDQGEGQFRRSDVEPRIAIPNWVIKSW